MLADALQDQLALLGVDSQRNQREHRRQLHIDIYCRGADDILAVDTGDFHRNRSERVSAKLHPLFEVAGLVVVLHRLFGAGHVHPDDVIIGARLHLDDDLRANRDFNAVLRRHDFNGGGRNGEREERETGGKAKRGGSLHAQR